MVSLSKPVGWIYVAPFIVYFMLAGVAILHTSSNQESSVVNQIVDSFAYGLAIVMLVFRQRNFLSYLILRATPLCILLILALLSIFWTDFPRFLLMGFFHKLGASFIAMSAACLLITSKNKFFEILLFVFFFYFAATILFSLKRPDLAQMPATLYGEYRAGLRGLTLHPNNLGAICVDAVWVALCASFLIDNKKKKVVIFSIFLVVMVSYCLVKADSMTSILVSVGSAMVVLWFKFMSSNSDVARFLKILFVFLLLTVLMGAVFLIKPEVFSVEYFFKLIGRDSTFTGRAGLWDFAIKGFNEKPILGWGEDNLLTFHKYYHQGPGQLHNGYLDLLVRGGITSILLFAWMLFQVLNGVRFLAKSKDQGYLMILSFVSVWLVHNITEASIFKSPNVLWVIFLILYFYSIGSRYAEKN